MLTSVKSVGKAAQKRKDRLMEMNMQQLEQYTRTITIAGDKMYKALMRGFQIGPILIAWAPKSKVSASFWGYHTGAESRVGQNAQKKEA